MKAHGMFSVLALVHNIFFKRLYNRALTKEAQLLSLDSELCVGIVKAHYLNCITQVNISVSECIISQYFFIKL